METISITSGTQVRRYLLMSIFPALLLSLGFSAFVTAAPLHTVRRWNQIAYDASGYDHANAREQLGPGRAARALAIANIALFDAANAGLNSYESYTGLKETNSPLSLEAAICYAVHDTLAWLFPSQRALFAVNLAQDINALPNNAAKTNGIRWGKRVASTMIERRSGDGALKPEPFLNSVLNPWVTSIEPGCWRMDPISQIPMVLGGYWSNCIPFVLKSSSQFRIPPFPAMTSAEYAESYDEAKRLGGDGVNTPTERTADQTQVGIYWAYDGTPSLCAPPRLYNQIASQIALQMGADGLELARVLALVNVAFSDATLAAWESKYYYNIWRPVTGIREADPGTGPTGLGDGNPNTVGDVNFHPLGAPASNLNGPNFTPPFPAYPSGHATMGGALFQALRRYYGTDDIPFTFVSDEYNGITRANDGTIRPLIPRTFANMSQAEEENGQSRIYLGIHWSFDKLEGIALGRRVADYVFENAFRVALHVRRQQNSIILAWSAREVGYQVQVTTSFPSGIWTDVTAGVEVVNGENTVSLPTTADAQFFRLKKP